MYVDEDQWIYDNTMSKEVDIDYENEQECGVNETHVDCSDAFNTSQWARSVANENGFVAVTVRSDTHIGSRGKSSFVLIGCEMSGQYKCRKKEFVRRDTRSRKCGCPFKLHGKPVIGGEGWMVKLIYGIHNHELAKSLVGHPYAGRLTKEEKNIITDMTKSMVKPKNILLTLKEHNVNSCTTIKQIYNARSAYRSSIRGSNTEMQHLMKLLGRDQYIHWHRLKDEFVVRDLFWCHPDVVKLCKACHLVFFIDNTYKTSRYRLLLLDFVGVTLSVGFAYLEGERVNNVVWALERFQGLFLRRNRLPVRLIIDECSENCIPRVYELVVQVSHREERQGQMQIFNRSKKKLGSMSWITGVLWLIVLLNSSSLSVFRSFKWLIHLGQCSLTMLTKHGLSHTRKNLLQPRRISVWDAMNNMITLQHAESKASFETSTHVVGHVFKKTLYKRILGMVSRYALNEIATEFERVHYAGKNPSSCGCVMRTTHDLPCACELSRYVVGSIPLNAIHMFWRRLSFSDQGLCEAEVSIKEEMETISKRFEELDVCGKVTLKKIAYPDQNSMCPLLSKVNTKGAPKKLMNKNQRSTKRDPSYWEYVDAFHSVQNNITFVKRTASFSDLPKPTRIIPMLDQFEPFIQGFFDNIVDVKADGNCRYRSIAALLGMGEDSWSLVRNEFIKELGKWSRGYINLFGGTERFEELRLSLLVNGFSKIRCVIASRYNVILVLLSQQQSMIFFPLRSQPPADSSMHRMICVGHVFGNHFVQLTNKQFLDEIYYRQPFTDTGNQICIQCMQLKNDDDVNTMLMSNHQFSCVGPIELLYTIDRTPNEILNLLQGTMTPTHDVLLYYNGRWNMSRQNNFVGYVKLHLKGFPLMYSDKVIKFEIIELKTNDDVLKVLVQSNYWKQFGPIEILAVMEMEDDVPMLRHD
ncbi:putative protein FAR1-RELATED SEQUENCE 10 [Glycine soja]